MKKILIAVSLCMAVCLFAGCGKTNEKLDEANKQIEELSGKINTLVELMNDYEDYEDEVHEIYDTSAVAEAYKSGDKDGLSEEDAYILKQATKAIKEIIKDDMTDYEKEKAVYDYMYDVTSFDDGSLSAIESTGEFAHTPYGFFKEHSTICVGNATTFKLFMDMLDIDCKLIHSTSNGEHAWNIVKLDDDWYHVDLTFDSPDSKEPAYTYFNVPDAAKNTGDYPWDRSEFPECKGTKYCYGLNNSIEIESVYEIPKQLKKAMDDEQGSIFLKLPVPSEGSAVDFKEQVYSMLNYIDSMDYFISSPMAMLMDNKETLLVNVVITYPDYDIEDEETEYEELIDYELMNEKFDEEFDGEISLYDDYEEDYEEY